MSAPASNRAERIAISDDGEVIEIVSYRGNDKLAILALAPRARGPGEIGRGLRLAVELLAALTRHFSRHASETRERTQ